MIINVFQKYIMKNKVVIFIVFTCLLILNSFKINKIHAMEWVNNIR